MSGPRPDERGETLLELLIAIVILGIAVLAIIGSVVDGIMVADIHRKQTTAGTAVRGYAEAIENYVGVSGYVPCASASSYAPSVVGFTVPTGFTASAAAALSWNGSAWVSCTSDNGFQKVTVRVASTDSRATETLDVVLRNPCRPTDAVC
jgi:type II secretory pathway pseudopilin PulG